MSVSSILGFDQSLTNSGWAAYFSDQKKNDLWVYGCIKTNPKKDLSARLNYIQSSIEDLIESFKPDQVVFEEVFMAGRHGKTTQKLFMVLGVGIAAAGKYGLPYRLMSSSARKKSSWRSILNMSSNKEEAQKILSEYFKEYELNEHTAEAICITHSVLISDQIRELKDFPYFKQNDASF